MESYLIFLVPSIRVFAMRSLLLSRLSRLSLTKPYLGLRHHLGGARFLSGTPLSHTDPRNGDMGRLVIRVGTDQMVLMDSVREARAIGASQGWVATLKDGVVCLHDDLLKPDSEPKVVTLPPLVTLPHCQTKMVTNVAMSSASPEDEDCIVAVKFVGQQLSLYSKGEWVNIRVTHPDFFTSRVMYSDWDEMFSMASSGGTHRGSWDLEEHRHSPKLESLRYINLPEFLQSEWGRLNCCCISAELVESRNTGEMFMVKRFRERNNDKGGRLEEKHIMVFKLNHQPRLAMYVEDIGDLCIFLSESEPFCLSASLYGGIGNSVHFLDKSEQGIFSIKEKRKTSSSFFPYLCHPYHIPPQSYLDDITIPTSGFASDVYFIPPP